MAQYMWYHL